MKSTRKTGYGALGLQKSTMAKKSTVKVNTQSKSTQVNGLVNILVNDDIR